MIASANAATLTQKIYSQIKVGMTYDQVKAIIGEDGDQVSETEIRGFVTAIYTWQDGDNKQISSAFENDHLVGKSQHGVTR
jgi:hypothetical protein